jgi:hypothetical protein
MIFVSWKKIGGAGKTFGAVWAAVAALIVIGGFAGNDSTQPTSSTNNAEPVVDQASVQQNKQLAEQKKAEEEASAKAAAEAKAKAKAEADAKAKAEADAKAKAEEEAHRKAEAEKIPGTIGMNPEEFKTAFNKASDTVKSSLKIKNIKVDDGQVQNTFQVMLTDKIAITGTVNKKDGSVRDVLLLGQGDGTAKSGTDIIVMIGTIIMATNSELSADDRGNVLRDLGLFDKNLDLNKLDKTTIRNGIKYHITGSDKIGLMFSAGDANEK